MLLKCFSVHFARGNLNSFAGRATTLNPIEFGTKLSVTLEPCKGNTMRFRNHNG